MSADISFGKHSLDVVVLVEMKNCSISGQGSILAGNMRMVQNNLPRLVGNCATLCLYVGRLGTSQRQVDLRLECQHLGLARIINAHGPATGLGGHNFHSRMGESIASIFVEDQIAGLQVDGIFDFLRSSLVRAGQAGGISTRSIWTSPVAVTSPVFWS